VTCLSRTLNKPVSVCCFWLVTVNLTQQTDTGLFSVRFTHVTVNQKQQTDTGLFSFRLRHVTINQKQQTE
jgi:hypothetical protein